MMNDVNAYLFIKLLLIALGIVIFLRSERIAIFIFFYLERAITAYFRMLSSVFKLSFMLIGLILILYNAMWIYKPDLNWIRPYIAYGSP